MFTGLVQTLGTVDRVTPDGHGGARLAVREPAVAPKLELGESVAVNGCCLTVVGADGDTFAFECGPETLARTVLGGLEPGRPVNLERALRAGDPLGGHFVTGHVDTVGILTKSEVAGDWRMMEFTFAEEFAELLVPKGSVAVDGVSLTVTHVGTKSFGVMLIPHTLAHTTLGTKGPGSAFNLEFDILAKHVAKLISARVPKAGA